MNVLLSDDHHDLHYPPQYKSESGECSSRYDESQSSELSAGLVNGRDRAKSSESIESGDRHGRLLLAALLENFCRLYEADPKKSERLFSVLCKTLSAMGILDQENVSELAGVRSQYSKAFKHLMLQAKEAVDKEDEKSILANGRTISYHNDLTRIGDPKDYSSGNETPEKSDIFAIESTGSRLSLADWLGYEDTKYYSEFEELGLLGKGGFGAVYHVRNKIDEREYAVKKITMRRASTNHAKIYREIKTLARLEHPNIIRYFSSWLEHSRLPKKKNNDARHVTKAPSALDSQNDDMLFQMDHEEPSFSTGNPHNNTDLEDSCGVVFEASDNEEDEAHDNISAMSFDHYRNRQDSKPRQDSRSSAGTASSAQTTSSLAYSFEQEASSMPSSARFRHDSMSGSVEEIPRDRKSLFSMSLPHNQSKYNRRRRKSEASVQLTLFIQMHLCPSTLRDHIRARNSVYCERVSKVDHKFTSRTYIDLFRSILEGAKYVHHSGLCHRDIKPSNIFLAQVEAHDRNAVEVIEPESGRVIWIAPKLGDFGLVLPTFSGDGDGGVEDEDDEEEEEEDGVGTAIYGAPEQFSRLQSHMTSKCDVFALGIVFFEMLYWSTNTAMERAKLLGDLRGGILPDQFVRDNPAESAVILAMTCVDPAKRPSVEEILEMEIVVSREQKEKTFELKRIMDENKALRQRIMELELGANASQ